MDCRVKPGNDGWKSAIQVNRKSRISMIAGVKPGNAALPAPHAVAQHDAGAAGGNEPGA
jgi:hypothetical protein